MYVFLATKPVTTKTITPTSAKIPASHHMESARRYGPSMPSRKFTLLFLGQQTIDFAEQALTLEELLGQRPIHKIIRNHPLRVNEEHVWNREIQTLRTVQI